MNQAPILHVSFNAPSVDGPQFPTILPMLGAIGNYPGDSETSVYLHGSSAGRLFRITSNAEVPMCVAGTLLDGYILALSAFHHSCNYRSTVVFGHGRTVTDPDEIQYALNLITNNAIPQRWENCRGPPTNAELTATGILKVEIEAASAKTRTGRPDDDRADLQNQELVGQTWVGMIPAYQMLGDPIEADYNKVKRAPEYLSDWVADVNSMAEQYAVDAVV